MNRLDLPHVVADSGARASGLSSIAEIVADLKAGKMVVLVDEEDRENEGDLVLAAERVTPEAINFMARYGRGLVCLTLTQERCEQLRLPLMVPQNQSVFGTNFTVSIDAVDGVSTGISAADRARTIRTAILPHASAADLVQPGHIFPLMAHPGGVLARAGHTEAGCDLAQMAGLEPAAVICEIMKDDGEMARLPDLLQFARQHRLKVGTIADAIAYRISTESLVTRVAERNIETVHGTFRLVAFVDKTTDATHLAFVKGNIHPAREVLVRVYDSVWSVMDLLDTRSKRHSWNFNDALATIDRAGCGVIVLLYRHETAADLLRHFETEGTAVPRPKTTMRNYGIGAQILKDLGVRRMRLLDSPRKMPNMSGFDLEITGYQRTEDALTCEPLARAASSGRL